MMSCDTVVLSDVLSRMLKICEAHNIRQEVPRPLQQLISLISRQALQSRFQNDRKGKGCRSRGGKPSVCHRLRQCVGCMALCVILLPLSLPLSSPSPSPSSLYADGARRIGVLSAITSGVPAVLSPRLLPPHTPDVLCQWERECRLPSKRPSLLAM